MTAPTHPHRHAAYARRISPHSGWCLRCGMPWDLVEPYVVNFSPSSGCFPCCKRCWRVMGLQERLDHASLLVDKWNADQYEYGIDHEAESKRILIDAAIIKGWPS